MNVVLTVTHITVRSYSTEVKARQLPLELYAGILNATNKNHQLSLILIVTDLVIK